VLLAIERTRQPDLKDILVVIGGHVGILSQLSRGQLVNDPVGEVPLGLPDPGQVIVKVRDFPKVEPEIGLVRGVFDDAGLIDDVQIDISADPFLHPREIHSGRVPAREPVLIHKDGKPVHHLLVLAVIEEPEPGVDDPDGLDDVLLGLVLEQRCIALVICPGLQVIDHGNPRGNQQDEQDHGDEQVVREGAMLLL
jgi:hypothetical protein